MLTLVIAGVWYTAGGFNLSQTTEDIMAQSEGSQAEEQVASPLLIIKEDAQGVISSFTDKVSEFSSEFNSSVTDTTTGESTIEIVDSASETRASKETQPDVIDFN